MELKQQENEISLLDLLLVVAANLKLLMWGPLVIGLVALAFAYALPQSFTSQAILALPTTTTTAPAQAAAMMISPLVLDPVIKSLDLAAGRSAEQARAGLVSQIKAAVGKDGLLRLDVTAASPTGAQTIAKAVIDSWLKSTAPGERDRADLETRLVYAKASLASVSRLLDRLTTGGGTLLNKPLTLGDAGTGLVAAGELQARYLTEVLNIPRSLQGLSHDVVVQSPTLPVEPVAPKKSLIAVLAALGSGFALLLWVFMRQAWVNAALDPQAAQKHARLRAAMGFSA